MIYDIINGVTGILLIIGFSYLMASIQEYSEKKSKQKQPKKFQFLTKHYRNLEKASENATKVEEKYISKVY